MRRLRLFVAVDPSPSVRERIARSLILLRGKAPSAKWVDPGAFHLTLAFLGETDHALVPILTTALGEVAALHAPLRLKFRNGSCFGAPRRPRTLWINVEGDVDRLAALQRDVKAALMPHGLREEGRAFLPHLTLARSRDRRGDKDLVACVAALDEDFGESEIETLTLYRSDLGPTGAHYTPLSELKLGGTFKASVKAPS